MRRPGLATAIAVLFALSALSDVYNLAEWAGGWGGEPGPLALMHVPAGLLAAGVVAGVWRRTRWAAPLAAIWGVLGSTAALTLGQRVALPPEVPSGARAVVSGSPRSPFSRSASVPRRTCGGWRARIPPPNVALQAS